MFFSPIENFTALKTMKEGHDGSGMGLILKGFGSELEELREYTLLSGRSYYMPAPRPMVPYEKIKTAYYDVCKGEPFTLVSEANRCMSCGVCRDCHMCEVTCYYVAISRKEYEDGSYEYIVDEDLCIGCSFCAGICPTGVWEMVENI